MISRCTEVLKQDSFKAPGAFTSYLGEQAWRDEDLIEERVDDDDDSQEKPKEDDSHSLLDSAS